MSLLILFIYCSTCVISIAHKLKHKLPTLTIYRKLHYLLK